MKKIPFTVPYYFYIFIVIDTTESGEYFGSIKYRIKLGFTRDHKRRLNDWRNDLKNMLRKYGYPENALVIDDYYLVIPGVFKMDGDYILIGRKNKNIERFDQYMRNCLCEMGFTKTPNYDIKPLEKFGIDKVFSIEGLNLYDNKTFDDVKEFINNVFIPSLKNHDEKYKQYYFVLNENEYNHFCKTEVSKIDKDVSKLNTKQIKDYIKIKYDVSLDMTFLTLINIDNNPYDDIESILTYMYSYLSEGTCKLLVKEYDKVNNNYMLEKTICEWLCISKDEKNEEDSLF